MSKSPDSAKSCRRFYDKKFQVFFKPHVFLFLLQKDKIKIIVILGQNVEMIETFTILRLVLLY